MLDPVNVKYFKLVVDLKKETSDELSGNCPVCSDTKNRLHLYDTEIGNLVHCFNSGCALSDKHHNMKNFLDIAAPEYYEQYKRETFKGTIKKIKEETSLQDVIKQAKEKVRTTAPAKTAEKEIPLQTLFKKASSIPECVEYLAKRNITSADDWYFSDAKFFTYNEKSVYLKDYLIIPIYNKDYKYKGFYSRSIHEKRFSTFLMDDTEKIWIKDPAHYPDIVCEGVFDALSSGFDNPAAMLSASLSKKYKSELPRDVIIATDNDKTGIEKAKEFQELGFKIFVWPDIKEKDFNEMLQNGYNENEIKQFILDNTYQGLLASVKLGMKEK